MQTLAKQEPQSKATNKPALIPEDIKKVIEHEEEAVSKNADMSGSLTRLLDACSDCI